MSDVYLSKKFWMTNKSFKPAFNHENLALSVIRELVKYEILDPLRGTPPPPDWLVELRDMTNARKKSENEKYKKLILWIKDKKDALLGRITTGGRRRNIF